MTTPQTLIQFKESYFRSPKHVHLNNAGVAPINKKAYEAVTSWAKRLHEEGVFAIYELAHCTEHVREKLARFINAKPEGIAIFQGAANAISQVAFGLDFKPGDEILVWDQEYPSNFYPWRDAAERAGAKFVLATSGKDLATPVEALLSKVTSRTKMIAVSWVQYQSGAITDLKALTSFTRQKNILTCADVIQGVGHLPFDFQDSGLDFAIGGSHKWMTSPIGVGYIAANPDALKLLKPISIGAFSYGTDMELSTLDAKLRTDAGRFEPGSKPMIEQAAFAASLQLFTDVGMKQIASEAEHLATRLADGLRERNYQVISPNGDIQKGAIVTFKSSDKSHFKRNEELEANLKEAGISFAKRAGGFRLSPHAFNFDADIDTALRVVAP